VSGSYAYVAAPYSDSLVVVDISNPAIPVIRGSVVSSSLLDHVRVTQGRPFMMLARPRRGASAADALSRALPHLLSRACAHRLMASP
jgi:hypothetical protein